SLQRKGLRQKFDRAISRMARVRAGRRRRRVGRRRETAEALKFDYRKIPSVHVDQQVPFFLRAALRDDEAVSVADRACRPYVLIGDGLIQHAMLGEIHRRFGFLGSGAVIVAQILDDGASVFGRQRQSVQSDHSLDRLLPTFGRAALKRDAGQPAFLIFLVAGGAFLNCQLVGDGNAFITRFFRRFFRRLFWLFLGPFLRLGVSAKRPREEQEKESK